MDKQQSPSFPTNKNRHEIARHGTIWDVKQSVDASIGVNRFSKFLKHDDNSNELKHAVCTISNPRFLWHKLYRHCLISTRSRETKKLRCLILPSTNLTWIEIPYQANFIQTRFAHISSRFYCIFFWLPTSFTSKSREYVRVLPVEILFKTYEWWFWTELEVLQVCSLSI